MPVPWSQFGKGRPNPGPDKWSPSEPIFIPQADRKTLVDLEDDQCRFPYGDPLVAESFYFCGKPKLLGLAYCTGHAQHCYEHQSSSKRMLIAARIQSADGDLRADLGRDDQNIETAAGDALSEPEAVS